MLFGERFLFQYFQTNSNCSKMFLLDSEPRREIFRHGLHELTRTRIQSVKTREMRLVRDQTAELDIAYDKMIIRLNYVLFKSVRHGFGLNQRSGGV
jgi:hypothetical protein